MRRRYFDKIEDGGYFTGIYKVDYPTGGGKTL